MSTEMLSNLVITRVHSVSTMYSPDNIKVKRSDRPRWAVVIKYEGETVYTSRTEVSLGRAASGDPAARLLL